MSPRLNLRAVREYFIKTREKRIKLMNYLRSERQRIIERERQKMWRRMLFWGAFLGTSYFFYNEVYCKNLEIRKMNKKLDNFYAPIMDREILKDELTVISLRPNNIDELTNLVSLAYRYHYKIIIRMSDLPKREKIIMCDQFQSKCLFINLSLLQQASIDPINSTLFIETGASCSKVNSLLQQNGYLPLFPPEFNSQKVYDAIVHNLPTNQGDLSSNTVSLELISASGQNFRSAGETNKYGQIPSLNPLFMGTGGIFALPSAITIKIQKKPAKPLKQENLRININNDNLKIEAIRKLTQLDSHFIEVELSNAANQKDQMFLTCKEKYPMFGGDMKECANLAEKNGILVQEAERREGNPKYNLFFSANNSIFQEFLFKFGREVEYSFRDGLLKVRVEDGEDQEKMMAVVNEVTSHNGVLVWCQSHELLNRIKPSLDSLQVGAELMRKIVQVREGLDRRNIFYSHNRYQDYFAKGLFRRMTQLFW